MLSHSKMETNTNLLGSSLGRWLPLHLTIVLLYLPLMVLLCSRMIPVVQFVWYAKLYKTAELCWTCRFQRVGVTRRGLCFSVWVVTSPGTTATKIAAEVVRAILFVCHVGSWIFCLILRRLSCIAFVFFLRFVNHHRAIHCAFVKKKSRVAPVRNIAMHRVELIIAEVEGVKLFSFWNAS